MKGAQKGSGRMEGGNERERAKNVGREREEKEKGLANKHVNACYAILAPPFYRTHN